MNNESPVRTNLASDSNHDDDRDLDDENLDLFLSLVESRLRADFTSTDLARLIASQGVESRAGGGSSSAASSTLPSGNQSSPSKFLRLICRVFHRAAKPVKLRTLMSVLGLESDRMIDGASSVQTTPEQCRNREERKTDNIVWKLLEQAEEDDEKWVRVVAGILRGIMFKSGASNELGSEVEDVNYYADPKSRGKTAGRELRKVTEAILNGVKEACSNGTQELSKAQSTYDGSDTTQQKAELESLLIGKDACPTFVPYRYALLSPETIKSIMPEVDVNNHFSANMNASIFKVDAEVEEKRAEEEGKELQLQTQRNGTVNNITAGGGGFGRPAASVIPGRAPSELSLPGRMRGRFASVGGRGGGDKGTSSLFLRPSAGRGGAAGRSLTTAGNTAGRLAMAGRSGSLGRFGAGGRGRAAALVGQTPLQRRTPGSTRAILNSSVRTGGVSGGDASKMKIIDVAEVEGLNRTQMERESLAGMSKSERRRKLLEDAAAAGLRSKKPRPELTDTDAHAEHNNLMEANTSQPDNALTQQHDLVSLLEKSNKLSDEDREKIQEFFRNQSSTIPDVASEGNSSNGQWKVKLNEERTIDPVSGESVKETLYLELDFTTRQYKKTKKIKRK
ncbi:hypothetical protein HJC23_004609 [Cyclotella cryptica]|uniref:Uncharacterized protein n=1 Tax=Cyclotella cryptica TaxID=29204 RepID=A0ABD3QGE1_9STRA|eukprot:CCRYP_005919-RA/>CCRYP_005919-RA protein AED:0.02 eAED:-0.01 QI:0/-1/0/1/-1/1/1/0/619